MTRSPQTLILWGGMDFHEPQPISDRFADLLRSCGHNVNVTNDTSVLDDAALLSDYDLIVINMTMGDISDQQESNLLSAIRDGTGLAGWHGGIGDALRDRPNFQYAVGGQWVAHPGNIIEYTVNVNNDHEITKSISDFTMHSEQYYMHVDPAVNVLATTRFTGEYDSWIDDVVMPVAWTKMYGKGRVFYCSLGHVDADFDASPDAAHLICQGLVWATRKRS